MRFRLETAKTLPFWFLLLLNLELGKNLTNFDLIVSMVTRTICQKELELQAVISLSDKRSCLILSIPHQNDFLQRKIVKVTAYTLEKERF